MFPSETLKLVQSLDILLTANCFFKPVFCLARYYDNDSKSNPQTFAIFPTSSNFTIILPKGPPLFDAFMAYHEISRGIQLSPERSFVLPSRYKREMNEHGSTHPGGAHGCSSLGCHKDIGESCCQPHNLLSQPASPEFSFLSLTAR